MEQSEALICAAATEKSRTYRKCEEIIKHCRPLLPYCQGGQTGPLSCAGSASGTGSLAAAEPSIFHSAKEGRKLDIWRKNSRVCFEMCHEGEAERAKHPCDSAIITRAWIGFGDIRFLDVPKEKCEALSPADAAPGGPVRSILRGAGEGCLRHKIINRLRGNGRAETRAQTVLNSRDTFARPGQSAFLFGGDFYFYPRQKAKRNAAPSWGRLSALSPI
jgi:hypothetical protein